MHILYAVTTCSDRVYARLFADAPVKPAFQSQKYHRLLIEGLAASAQVDVVANPPMNKNLMDCPKISLPDEEEGGARYHYIPAIRNPFRKLLAVGFGTFFGCLKHCRKDSAVVVDVLNRTAALAALLAAKAKRAPCVGIVTDLPDMLGGGRFSKALANFVLRRCTHYVFLTEAMNDYYHNTKPYVVLEGHADAAMEAKKPDPAKKTSPRGVLYAGGVSKQYGLEELTQGFLQAQLPNARLEIYGPGGYVEELKEIAARDPRVFYGGMLLSSQIVEKEQQATLLVNPRPTREEYVKYSFPSKTMEYLSSGTPVLTTRLPGMPEEYHPYVDFIEDETVQGVADALRASLSRSDEELFARGSRGREFVLGSRNNRVQAQKILQMLSKDVKK